MIKTGMAQDRFLKELYRIQEEIQRTHIQLEEAKKSLTTAKEQLAALNTPSEPTFSTTKGAQEPYTFTLVFTKGEGAIAVLHVYGASSREGAYNIATSVLPQHSYEVHEGDETRGHDKGFSTWADNRTQRVETQR